MTFAALLFVVASGFALIFGLLRIVDLAHGALYLFGGYIGFTVAVKTGSFALGGIGAMAAIAAIGFVLDQGLLRFVRGNELRQVLLTLGFAFVLNDLALVIWGGDSLRCRSRRCCAAASVYSACFIRPIVCSCWSPGSWCSRRLWLLLNHTRLGALIRAGVDDAEMVEASGSTSADVSCHLPARARLWPASAG